MKRRVFLAIITVIAVIMPSSLRGGDTIIDCRHVFKDGEFLPNYFYMLFPKTGKYIEQACPRGTYFNCEICLCTTIENACGCVLDYFGIPHD